MSITVIISSLPTVAMEVLSPSLGSICGMAFDSVTPLFRPCLVALKAAFYRSMIKNLGEMA